MSKPIIGIFLLILAAVPPPSLGQISPTIINKCLEATVVVESYNGDQVHIGSGFLWQDETHVVTAWHVVAGAKSIQVDSRFTEHTLSNYAHITAASQKADLAILELNKSFYADGSGQRRRPLEFYSNEFQVEEHLWAFGAPLAVKTPDQTMVVSRSDNKGMKALRNQLNSDAENQILKLKFPSLDLPVLNLDGSLMLGHSGCAIVNAEGKVVGIGNGGLEIGRGWAIPARYIFECEPLKGGTEQSVWVNIDQLYGFDKAIENTPMPLIAKFDVSMNSGTVPIDISFTDRSQGEPSEWRWNFGDGRSDDQKNPIHTYTNPTYFYNTIGACWKLKPLTITLTVRNTKGEEHTTSLLNAVDLKPRQVQLNLQLQPSKLKNSVYAQLLPPNSHGCGRFSLAQISTQTGYYYVNQEIGLQVAPQTEIIENGKKVTYVFSSWSGCPLDDERILNNGHHWTRLRISEQMPDGITIIAHFIKKHP